MAVYDFSETTYVIYYGTRPDTNAYYIRYKEYGPNTQTHIPDRYTVEQFADEQTAIARAEELGYSFDDSEVHLKAND